MKNVIKKAKSGFTLIELMITVIIIGILVAVAMPLFNDMKTTATEKALLANSATVEKAMELYVVENPGSESATTTGLESYIKGGLDSLTVEGYPVVTGSKSISVNYTAADIVPVLYPTPTP